MDTTLDGLVGLEDSGSMVIMGGESGRGGAVIFLALSSS